MTDLYSANSAFVRYSDKSICCVVVVEDVPNPEVEPGSPALQADSLPSKPPQRGQLQVGGKGTKKKNSC